MQSVSQDVCEERSKRFEQMFSDIIKRLDNIEKKLDKNSNGKLLGKIVLIMLMFCTLTVGLVTLVVKL